MRGIGYTLSRLPTARAFLAGAAIIAGALGSAAHGQVSASGNGNGTQTTEDTRADEAAFAFPHPGSGGGIVTLPRPLPPADAAVMRRIFDYQSRGDIPATIRATADLDNPLLLGSALADRYLGRFHRSTIEEVIDWLVRYRDLPDAPAIYALLRDKVAKGGAPKGVALPPAPDIISLSRNVRPDLVPGPIKSVGNETAGDPLLDRAALDRALRGDTASALRLIGNDRRAAGAYGAQLRAEVARVRFTRNQDADALRIAQAALADVPAAQQPSLAFFIGGLAAWRLDRLEQARTLFEGGATATFTSPPLQAAAAFWASRAARRMHDGAATAKWLHVAADIPLTLHGLLARRILRLPTGIVPSGQLLSQADVDAVVATPEGKRAFALIQIDQPERAEAELRQLWRGVSDNPVFGRSVMMVAAAVGLTDLAEQMAGLLQARDGLRHDELQFPLPRLRPARGFSLDPALVYALTRVESNFDNTAVSPAGARGLMQIMPSTAQFIMGNAVYGAERLAEPAANLDIGQRYVALLAKQDGIGDDLIRMLASYNSGPGSFLRWSAGVRDGGDPLLFMEAIPNPETRVFVPTALLYSWIYAARLHLPAPSLDSLAAGEFPRFTPPAPGFTAARHARTIELVASGLH